MAWMRSKVEKRGIPGLNSRQAEGPNLAYVTPKWLHLPELNHQKVSYHNSKKLILKTHTQAEILYYSYSKSTLQRGGLLKTPIPLHSLLPSCVAILSQLAKQPQSLPNLQLLATFLSMHSTTIDRRTIYLEPLSSPSACTISLWIQAS